MAKQDTTGSLFSAEELTRAMGGFDFKEEGPVICLGMEFENEEARRAYFREELRNKLPELKTIEGFPSGKDEDIIKLSDPPYYTACPNPWLNDFIDNWEEEKNNLVKQGKREKEKVVKEPYATDVSEGKNEPIYNAHSYHTKVPPKAISQYLSHYTEEGDIVLDGFSGSGMTGVACKNFKGKTGQIEHRNVILNDLSPAATNLTYNNTESVNLATFKSTALEILNKAKEKYGWMFKTQDPESGKEVDVEYFVWSEISSCETCSAKLKFSELAFTDDLSKLKEDIYCPNCGVSINKRTLQPLIQNVYDKDLEEVVQSPQREMAILCYKTKGRKQYKKPDNYDWDVIDKTKQLPKTGLPIVEIPDMQMMRVGRMKASQIKYIHQFYFEKMRYILGYMWDLASHIEDARLQNIVKYWLDSQFVNLSYRNRYRPSVSFPYNPMTGVFYIPMMSCESNPFVAYKNKLTRIVEAFKNINETKGCSIVSTSSASSLPIKDNSIDYIFTDPPFGENIYYSDLNYYIEAWNGVYTRTEPEAIVDKVKEKNVLSYNRLIENCFREYFRVLKPEKWMTVVFSNTSASIWNGIQNSLRAVGFIIVNVSSLDKQQGSFQSVNTTTAVKQDLVITCYKPSSKLIKNMCDNAGNSQNVNDFIDELLEHLPIHVQKAQKTTTVIERSPKILYDRLVSYYVQNGYQVPCDSSAFQQILRDRYLEIDGMFFTAPQAAIYEEKKKLAPDFVPMGIIVSDEANGIEWLKNRLKESPKTYQEIMPEWMQAINGLRKGDVLPELRDILEENFIEEADGKWRIADPEKQVDLDKLRFKNLMKEFNLYVEAVNKPKAKAIKNARLEAVRAGFKECYKKKDFMTIIKVGDKISPEMLQEDEQLLRYYDVATRHI